MDEKRGRKRKTKEREIYIEWLARPVRPRQLCKGGGGCLYISVILLSLSYHSHCKAAHRLLELDRSPPRTTSHGDGVGRVRPGPQRGAVGGHGDGLPGSRVRAPRPGGPGGGGPARVPGLAPSRRRPVPVARPRPAPGPRRALHALGRARRRLRAPLRRARLLARGLPQDLRVARARLRRGRRAPAAPRRAGARDRPHFAPVSASVCLLRTPRLCMVALAVAATSHEHASHMLRRRAGAPGCGAWRSRT
jgi:hypothetical protein